jgi:hypothetical protein
VVALLAVFGYPLSPPLLAVRHPIFPLCCHFPPTLPTHFRLIHFSLLTINMAY